MPKTAFHTLLGEESELKQHGAVFKPRDEQRAEAERWRLSPV